MILMLQTKVCNNQQEITNAIHSRVTIPINHMCFNINTLQPGPDPNDPQAQQGRSPQAQTACSQVCRSIDAKQDRGVSRMPW
jgi:hypothetical protein